MYASIKGTLSKILNAFCMHFVKIFRSHYGIQAHIQKNWSLKILAYLAGYLSLIETILSSYIILHPYLSKENSHFIIGIIHH